MLLRRFTAATTSEALRQLREALGDEALVLSTGSEPDGRVVITAAVDVDLGNGDGTDGRASGPDAPSMPEGTDPVSLDLAMIRTHLEQLGRKVHRMDRALLDLEGGPPALGPEARELADRLLSSGCGRPLADRIVRSFERELANRTPHGKALQASLVEHVAIAAGDRARLLAFVGPTGSGKTTTIAKVAARHVIAGGEPPGLVVADNQRIGAVEQLAAYARLLEAPLCVARDAAEMRDAIAHLAERQMTLVDTAGLSGDPAGCAEVHALLAAGGRGMRVIAVVSATASASSLDRAWPQIARLSPESCVVTKLDECGEPGAACAWLAEVGLPLAWLGTGHRVPDDLVTASGEGLARWLVAA